MKNPLSLILFVVSLVLLSATVFAGPGTGPKPKPAGGGGLDNGTVGAARPVNIVSGSSETDSITIPAGSSECNNDGVCVTTDKKSAKMTPATGDAGSATDVTTKSHFEGDIDGIDSNDSVSFGSSSTADVTGTGGSVYTGGGNIHVTNNGPANGPSIHVTNGKGTVTDVAGGTSQDFGE